MDLQNILVVCGILDMQNPARNCFSTIDSKGLTGINDFPMLRIKDVPQMVTVLNQEARFGAI